MARQKRRERLGKFQTCIATDSGLAQALQYCIVTVLGLTQVPARGIWTELIGCSGSREVATCFFQHEDVWICLSGFVCPFLIDLPVAPLCSRFLWLGLRPQIIGQGQSCLTNWAGLCPAQISWRSGAVTFH